jgi:hypothetical protein
VIAWLETTTVGVSRTETYEHSESGTFTLFGNTITTRSFSSAEASENWSATYFSSTASYETIGGPNAGIDTIKLVFSLTNSDIDPSESQMSDGDTVTAPNSTSDRQFFTETAYAQTSTALENTNFNFVSTTTEEQQVNAWTTSGPTSKPVFYQTEAATTVTTTTVSEKTYLEYGTTEAEETVYAVPYFNTIYEATPAGSNFAGNFVAEVLFSASTTNADAMESEVLGSPQSATRLTASFNAPLYSVTGSSYGAPATNPALTASFTYSAIANVPAGTITVCSFDRSFPQQTRTIVFRTSIATTAATVNETYFASQTVALPTKTTKQWFGSATKRTNWRLGSAYEEPYTILSSRTAYAPAAKIVLASSDVTGSFRGVSATTLHDAPLAATTSIASPQAIEANSDGLAPLRLVYGPYGRSVGNSIGAAFTFNGITESFFIPTSQSAYEALGGREAVGGGTSGSVYVLRPGYYTYSGSSSSASVSISGDLVSFTKSTSSGSGTNTEGSSYSTIGTASAYAPSVLVLKRGVGTPTAATEFGAEELNLLGYNIVGGAVGPSETAVEVIPRGFWNFGSGASFYQGSVTTRSDAAPTSAGYPVTYFGPELASVTRETNQGPHMVWAEAVTGYLPF